MHAAGEEITAGSELGIWLYPKGQEPKHRSYLIGFTGPQERAGRRSTSRRTQVVAHGRLHGAEGEHRHHQLPAALPSARQGDAGRGDSARRRTQIISYVDNFNFNWMTNYIYADDAAPAFPKGTIIHVTAFYDNTTNNKSNPDPEPVGRATATARSTRWRTPG